MESLVTGILRVLSGMGRRMETGLSLPASAADIQSVSSSLIVT